MIGFETDVNDLRKASGFVEDAGHAAETARRGVGGLDMPQAAGPGGIFNAFGVGPATAFGGSLGMHQVAAAYEYHRSKVEEALAQLAFTTQQASVALVRVADLYESADAEARMGVRDAAGEGL